MRWRTARVRASTLHRLAYRKGYSIEHASAGDGWLIRGDGAPAEANGSALLSSREAKAFLERLPDHRLSETELRSSALGNAGTEMPRHDSGVARGGLRTTPG